MYLLKENKAELKLLYEKGIICNMFKRIFNKSKRLSFKCNACNEFVEEKVKVNKDFVINGYDNIIEWSDFKEGDKLPDVDERIWVRSDKLPEEDSIRIVKAYCGFSFKIEEEFSTLYMPALSSVNGWEEYPEEINKSAIVKCQLKKVISYDEKSAWIVIDIIEVISLSKMMINYKERKVTTDYVECVGIYGASYALEYEDWLYFECNAQSDIGSWCLIKKHNDKYNLVLYNEWGFHYDFIYADNIIVSRDSIDKMLQKSIRSYIS